MRLSFKAGSNLDFGSSELTEVVTCSFFNDRLSLIPVVGRRLHPMELKMNVSSRTPEGLPSECPLCGANTNIEFSDPAQDAPCPNCGHLLWASDQLMQSVIQQYQNALGTEPGAIQADTSLSGLGADSLDVVELVMELEEEFDVTIAGDDAERIQTIRDAVRYIQDQRRNKGD